MGKVEIHVSKRTTETSSPNFRQYIIPNVDIWQNKQCVVWAQEIYNLLSSDICLAF